MQTCFLAVLREFTAHALNLNEEAIARLPVILSERVEPGWARRISAQILVQIRWLRGDPSLPSGPPHIAQDDRLVVFEFSAANVETPRKPA
jgi:hypothetical protein